MDLKSYIREVPNFPEPGVSFKDISPLLATHDGFRSAVSALAEPFKNVGVTKVAALDARGFIFAPPIANELQAGIVMVRKAGKLPGATHRHAYTLEYGTNILEIQTDALNARDKVLIVDDVIATGGSLLAALELIQKSGASVVGIAALIGLKYLGNYEQKLLEKIPSLKLKVVLEYT